MNKLLESILTSEFTFGFELEAYANEDKVPYKKNGEIDTKLFHYELEEEFSKYFGNEISIVEDGSLRNSEASFEFPTPKMNLTPLNIQKCIKFLYSLPDSKFEIYTDDTCGFHIHLSYPTITKEDVIWLNCNLAMDSDIQKLLSYFKLENGITIPFFDSTFASTRYLDYLKGYILSNYFKGIGDTIGAVEGDDMGGKYRIIRNHPQGTLEWRGPRNFLNEHNLKDIKNLFKNLLKFTKWISDTLESKTLNGYDRQTFIDMIKEASPTILDDFKQNLSTLTNKIIKKPKILTKLNYSLEKSTEILNIISTSLSPDNFKSFLLDLRYEKMSDNMLAAILIQEFGFYKYKNPSQSLPFEQLYTISPATCAIIMGNYNIHGKELLHIIDIFPQGLTKLFELFKTAFISSNHLQVRYKPWTNNIVVQAIARKYNMDIKDVEIEIVYSLPS